MRVSCRCGQLTDGLTVQLADSVLDTGLKDVPALYELWGCLSVIQTVIDAALEQGLQVVAQGLVRPVPGCLLVALSPGGGSAVALAHADGRRIDLTQQRPFTDRGLWQSVSFTQRPDLVLECTAPGTRPRLMIFDPKYKRDDGNGPQKADIDKMHAYRDAIIHADGGRIVRHATILYPGPTRCFGPGLSAISALPGEDAALADGIRRLLADHLFGA
ncbi:nuclease domain-containing protein [Niveispirillum irakense]|uniref:nuclease domain-containing protein n=1 Tax=Niveispirillum irakense TaxID=34011 RepID=UPI0003F4E16B|nr:nuclease domain-containing protein [Niveispirillum irakense]